MNGFPTVAAPVMSRLCPIAVSVFLDVVSISLVCKWKSPRSPVALGPATAAGVTVGRS